MDKGEPPDAYEGSSRPKPDINERVNAGFGQPLGFKGPSE